MIILWIIIGLVGLFFAPYGLLFLFLFFHSVERERVCRNCRDYDIDLEYCWQDGVHRPASCKACALFTLCKHINTDQL